MSYDLEDYQRPLPSDITMRVPVYRRRGIVASLAQALAAWSARRQLNRITRWYRVQAMSELPEHLREDIGLPPFPPRLPNWWELRR